MDYKVILLQQEVEAVVDTSDIVTRVESCDNDNDNEEEGDEASTSPAAAAGAIT